MDNPINLNELEKVCEWLYIEADQTIETSCNHTHLSTPNDPVLDDYRYCPYCGNEISFDELNEE